jgi:purine-binding chemotaxis protein CheW
MKRARVDWEQVRSRLRASERALEEALAESPARIDAAYRRRAIRLAEGKGDRRPVSEGVPALIFRLAGERYATELREIAETLPFARCTPVPGSPPQFLGVISLRGELRAVLDMRRLLGLPEAGNSEPGFVLVLRRQGKDIGLRVDSIEELRTIQPEEVSVAGYGRYTKGIAAGALMLLNMEAVLAEVFSKEGSLTK